MNGEAVRHLPLKAVSYGSHSSHADRKHEKLLVKRSVWKVTKDAFSGKNHALSFMDQSNVSLETIRRENETHETSPFFFFSCVADLETQRFTHL